MLHKTPSTPISPTPSWTGPTLLALYLHTCSHRTFTHVLNFIYWSCLIKNLTRQPVLLSAAECLKPKLYTGTSRDLQLPLRSWPWCQANTPTHLHCYKPSELSPHSNLHNRHSLWSSSLHQPFTFEQELHHVKISCVVAHVTVMSPLHPPPTHSATQPPPMPLQRTVE